MISLQEQLCRAFPELQEVINEEWRRKALFVWQEVYNRSQWKDKEAAAVPFSPSVPSVTLLEHTEAVIQNALQMAHTICSVHHNPDLINFDRLIIVCVLHDVDKLLAIEPLDSGQCRYSDIARIYQHGFYSAYYAEKAELPAEITAALISHTVQSRMQPSTLEGMILLYADIADADLCKFINGQSPSFLKTIGKTCGQ